MSRLKADDDELVDIDVDDVISRPLIDGPAHEHSGAMVKVGGRAHRRVRVNENDHAARVLPLVHKSVLERFRKISGYRPPALRGLTFCLWDALGYRKEVQGITGLSELIAKTNVAPGDDKGAATA